MLLLIRSKSKNNEKRVDAMRTWKEQCKKCLHKFNKQFCESMCSEGDCFVAYTNGESHNMDDLVSHPSHYTKGEIEVWDFILDQKLDYLTGTAIKYLCRSGYKESTELTKEEKAIQDLNKAIAYIQKRISVIEQTGV